MRYWVLLFGIVSWGVYGNDVLRSAVSTNFPDGLHTQYLTYFADKLHVPSEIGTMPYALCQKATFYRQWNTGHYGWGVKRRAYW